MLASNPIGRLKKIPAALKLAFFSKAPNIGELIDIIMEISVVARRDGLLALETESGKFDNPVLKKGLTYIADGITPERLKQNLEAESDAMLNDYEEAAKVFEGMGGVAPTMGVLGTVMGMPIPKIKLSAGFALARSSDATKKKAPILTAIKETSLVTLASSF